MIGRLVLKAKQCVVECLPDDLYLKRQWKKHTGKELNLFEPKTFNEKIQWLKIHDHNPKYTEYVDKYLAKERVKEILGDEYIIPTLGVWERFDEIDFDRLPNRFVLKCTHDSGSVFIIPDKEKMDKAGIREKTEEALKHNFYMNGREWPYKNVPPRILAEEFMTDESGYELKDYKVFVFGGKAKFIQVDFDRFTDHHRNFYDPKWQYVPFTTLYPTNPERKIDRPDCLEEMLANAEKIAGALDTPPFVRIDFYVIGSRLLFGEATFYHGSGLEPFMPEEYGRILGDMIDLSKVKKA